jgi:hypothetical protein
MPRIKKPIEVDEYRVVTVRLGRKQLRDLEAIKAYLGDTTYTAAVNYAIMRQVRDLPFEFRPKKSEKL